MPSFHYCKDSKAQGTHAPLLMCLLMCSSHQKAVAKKPKISRHIKPSPISLLISSSYKCWSCFLHCKTRWIRPVGSTCWYLVTVQYVWYVHAVLSSEQHACWPEVVQWLATCTNRMCQSIVKLDEFRCWVCIIRSALARWNYAEAKKKRNDMDINYHCVLNSTLWFCWNFTIEDCGESGISG